VAVAIWLHQCIAFSPEGHRPTAAHRVLTDSRHVPTGRFLRKPSTFLTLVDI